MTDFTTWRRRTCPFACCATALFLSVSSDAAETRSVVVEAGETRFLSIAARVDDRNFQDPPGYAHHGARTRLFARRIIVETIGNEPLRDFALIVNDKDWSSQDALRQSLALPADHAQLATRFYTFWKDHRFHATSGAKAQEDPLATLNFWGYTLCGEDTQAIARFLHGCGIPARGVTLNGHVAAEYFFAGKWNVIDGDQNAVFLGLDNRTFASAADLRADPFPALRTKVFGKHAQMNLTHSRFNTALYEFIAPREKKPMKFKDSPARPASSDTLFPGEKLVYHFDRAPARAVGSSDLREWGTVKEDALGVVELVANVAARPGSESEVLIASSSPIVEVVRHATGESINVAGPEPVFETRIARGTEDKGVSIFSQRARIALPFFQKGRNALHLRASRGEARVTLEYTSVREVKIERVRVRNSQRIYTDENPSFRIDPGAGADLVWWQIAPTRDFALILPNFEAVQKPVEVVVLDPLTETFFTDEQSWHFRFKARHQGVWSEWSSPFTFRVRKPSPPRDIRAVMKSGGEVELQWQAPGDATEYLVFGSDRLDFVPEIYAREEVVRMQKLQVVESRPNKNLLGSTRGSSLKLAASYRFYRVVAKRGGALSVPSSLIRAESEGTANLPAGKVLQMRAKRIEKAESRNGYVDEYVAGEMLLPD